MLHGRARYGPVEKGAHAVSGPDCLVDGDRDVDVMDLLKLLGEWASTESSNADLDCSGTVDVLDLLDLLAVWGECTMQ